MSPLLEAGSSPDAHANLVDLLRQAREVGVRELEVRPDGSFRAIIDALPPAPKPKPTREESEAADDELLMHSATAR